MYGEMAGLYAAGVTPSGKDNTADFWSSSAADGYGQKTGKFGIDKTILNRPGMSDAADAFYGNTAAGDAFIKDRYADVGSLGARTAPTAGYTSLGPGGYMKAASVGPMSMASASTVDKTDSDAVRAMQAAALARYGGIADGTMSGPGAQQLAANLATTKNANQSLAASGAGRMAPGAMRGLANRNADATGANNQAAGIVKSQEQMNAINTLASLGGTMRGADMEGANMDADLAARASYFNTGALNSGAMANAGFNQGASMFNADATAREAALRNSVNMANLEAKFRAMGMNDQTIAARMAMLQQQVNQQKSDKMGFWDLAAGNQKFQGDMDYRRAMDQQKASQQYMNAAAQGAAAYGGYMANSGGSGGAGGGVSGSVGGSYSGYDGSDYMGGLSDMSKKYYGG